jgi:hypothetical protein
VKAEFEVTEPFDDTVAVPAAAPPAHDVGALPWGPMTLKVTVPPNGAEALASTALTGVSVVPAIPFAGAKTEIVVWASTVTADDF